MALYVATDAVGTLLVPAIVVAAGASVGLTLYCVFARIQPLQRELQRIEGD